MSAAAVHKHNETGDLKNRHTAIVWTIWIVGLALKIFFALARPISDDVFRLYQQALDWYIGGHLGVTGAVVDSSGTVMPGALQNILLGVSIFFSHGFLSGAAVLLACATHLSLFLVYQSLKDTFPNCSKIPLSALIALTPWVLPELEVWNPSYALCLSCLFFAAWLNPRLARQRDFWTGFCILAVLQLHLSFVILILAAALGYRLRREFPRIIPLALGSLLGSVSIVPWIIQKLSNSETHSWLTKNVSFRWDSWQDLLKGIFRFWSFPTADVVRFLKPGHGYLGAFQETPMIWIILTACALGASGLLIFFQIKGTWRLVKSRDARWMWLAWVPILSMFLFLFSGKGASAHTFWILLPWSFVPIAAQMGDTMSGQKISRLVYANIALGLILLMRVESATAGSWFVCNEWNLAHGNSSGVSDRDMAAYKRLDLH